MLSNRSFVIPSTTRVQVEYQKDQSALHPRSSSLLVSTMLQISARIITRLDFVDTEVEFFFCEFSIFC